MNGDIIVLDTIDLLIASLLVLVAGAVSLSLGLRLERQLALATVRTVVQLLIVGLVLRWVFSVDEPFVVLGIILVMVLAASRAAVQRPTRSFQGAAPMAFLTLVISALLTTFAVTSIVINVEPWYSPRYVIPILGMVLGNGLTGISLCVDDLLESLIRDRSRVEMELAHGATRWESARNIVGSAVRRGMIPIINSMMVVGVVSLPGMMTGQILAGANPIDAVKYQIVVMFMIASATSLGCILVSILIYLRLFNVRHQLLSELIYKRNGE